MEISLPIKSTPISHNVNDGKPVYDRFDGSATYLADSQWQSGDNEYQYIGQDLTPITYNSADEANYIIGDIVYKDGTTNIITGLLNQAPRVSQPEEYLPDVNVSRNMANWNTFWEKIATGMTSRWDFTFTENGVTHTYTEDEYYTDWYTISFSYTGQAWSPYNYYYSTSSYVSKWYVDYDSANGLLYITYGSTVKAVTYNHPVPEEFITTYTGDDGYTYRVGRLVSWHSSIPTRRRYEVQRYNTYSGTYQETTRVYEWSSDSASYPTHAAYCLDPTGTCGEKWFPRTICIRQNADGVTYDAYVLTNVAARQEIVETAPVYEEIVDLTTFPDMVATGVINALKPFDGKAYTYFEQASPVPITYTIQPDIDEGEFSTVAFSGIIADSIDATFKDSAGTIIATGSVAPQNNRDTSNRLPAYPTTAILYALDTNGNIVDVPNDGYVEVTINSTSIIRVGTILLGLNVAAGFTNLSFSNKFIDWSPREVDQWGGVTYIDGVKTNVFSGSADIIINDYDMINRLMVSIGGSTVILNGSDSLDNSSPVDNPSIFSSTMLIGRIKDFQLKTNPKKNDLGHFATYSFVLEENV